MRKYNEGEIYLISEIEYPSGKSTSFFKIGLVRFKDKRNTSARILEHQTGNPRRLVAFPGGILRTQAVDLVEAQLHKHFATKRILGEWFQLNTEKEIKEVIEQANHYAQEVSRRLPLFQQAAKLRSKNSNGEKVEPTEEILGKAKSCLESKAKSAKCDKLLNEIDQLVTYMYESGEDVGRIANVSTRKYKATLDPDKLQKKWPELWAKYQVPNVRRQHAFTLVAKPASIEKLDSDFLETIEKLEQSIRNVENGEDMFTLIETKLELTHLKAVADWEVEVLTAELQISTGLYDGISGVTNWKRRDINESSFDEETFVAENPELLSDLVKPARQTSKLRVKNQKS